MTVTCENLFKTVLSISGGGGDGGGGGSGVKAVMDDLLERLPENFELVGLGEKAKALQGQLNMSASMEDLVVSLTTNEVPGRNPFGLCSWEKYAWWSKKGLVTWFLDMIKRVDQLVEWTEELIRPFSLWLPGMFNPTAFLTAVMQVTARETKMPLDQMSTETHISTIMDAEVCEHHPKDGAFVHGIYIEGARWSTEDEIDEKEDLDGTECGGCLLDSRLKELLAPMPLIYVKAVRVQPQWEASAVGYLRHDDSIYDCPVYVTTFRGPTYVVLATLKTMDPVSKWVLAGVALVFQTDD